MTPGERGLGLNKIIVSYNKLLSYPLPPTTIGHSTTAEPSECPSVSNLRNGPGEIISRLGDSVSAYRPARPFASLRRKGGGAQLAPSRCCCSPRPGRS